MLFLTYVKGDLVRTWVLAASQWLGQEVSLYHVDQYDPYLWTSIEGAFRRQFADTLEMEQAQNKLRQGIRMKEGKIDEYVAEFDTLISQAGYKADDVQTLEKFISGLPVSLYETIYYTNWTTQKLTKHGVKRPSSDKKSGCICSPSNKGGRRLITFDRQAGHETSTSIGFSHPHPRSKCYGHLSQDPSPGSSLTH
jgi:hypothetical protein